MCTFSPLSLVGVHWSMFYGSNTCFFSSVRLSYALLSLPAIILPRRRFVVVVYSPPSLKHRHRMRISLHRCSERHTTVAEGEDWRGRTTYYTRARAHYNACSFNIIVSSGPCETAPAAKESRELSVPPYLPTSSKIPPVIMRQKYISYKKLISFFSFDFCSYPR